MRKNDCIHVVPLLYWAHMKKCPVVHFEMPYKDAQRVSGFYTKVFGWDMNMLGPEMENYILAGTTEAENMMPTKPGAINGGLFPASDENNRYPLVTIQVEDITKAMEMVKQSGGKVLKEPVEIAGIGMYVAINDTEGNRVSLLQPLQA